MGKDIQSKISRCFPYEANKGTFAVKSSGRLNNKCGKNKCFFRSFQGTGPCVIDRFSKKLYCW
jgi:hypothetical protein